MPAKPGSEEAERRPSGDVHRGAPPRGSRTLTAVLPNGRSVWLRVEPALAPALALREMGGELRRTAERRAAAAAWQGGAIDVLARTVAADALRLSSSKRDRARSLRARLLAGDTRLARRLAARAADYRSRIEKQVKLEREAVRRLGRRDLWDKVVIATSAPLFAAYGQKGRPFGANNLALFILLLIWLVGDDVVDALFGSKKRSPDLIRDTDAWSYVAPIGNLLAGWWLLNGRQHERFVAGLATSFTHEPPPPDSVPSPGSETVHRYVARVPLRKVVAPDHFPDFKTFAGVPAVATVRSVRWSAAGVRARARSGSLSAQVEEGMLVITFVAITRRRGARVPPPSAVDSLEVAWMVDTSEPSSASTSAGA